MSSKTGWLSGALAELEARTRKPEPASKISILSAYLKSPRGIPTDIAIIALLIAILHIGLFVPKAPVLPDSGRLRDFVFNLWQVGAATVAIALVILLLIVESVQRSAEGDFVWKRFSTDRRLYLAIIFLLSAIATTGIGGLLLLPKADDSLPTPSGLENVVIIDLAIFLASLFLILWLYQTMFQYMSPTYGASIAREYLLDSVRQSIVDTIRTRMRDTIMRGECSQIGMSWDSGMKDWPGMSAIYSQQAGVVVDINVKKLRSLQRLLSFDQTPSARICAAVGSVMTKGKSVIALVASVDANESVASSVRDCFKIRPSNER